MTKFVSMKKIQTKIIITKRNLELSYLRFLYYSKKHVLTCPGLERLIFQFLYHQNRKLMQK